MTHREEGSIVFSTLAIEHFMSFRERITLRLDTQGLILIQGENRASTALSSNGVGKSALVSDALCWVLFGETARGTKFDAVANRHTTEPCHVSLDFWVGDIQWVLQRGRRPAFATLMNVQTTERWDNDDVKGRVEALLGFGLNAFRMGAIFGQTAFSRFALTDAEEQLRVFDEILGVDFKSALRKATESVAETKASIETLTAQLAAAETSVAALVGELKGLNQAHKAFATQKKERLAALQLSLAEEEDGLATLLRQQKHHKAVLAHHDTYNCVAQGIKTAHQEVCAQRAVMIVCEARLADAQKAFKRRWGEMTRLKNADQCPTCFRPIEGRDVTEAFRGVISRARKAVSDIEKERETIFHQTTLAEGGLRDAVAAAGERVEVGDPLAPYMQTEEDGYLLWMKNQESMFALTAVNFDHVQDDITRMTSAIASTRQALEIERSRTWDGAERRDSLRAKLPVLTQRIRRAERLRCGLDRLLNAKRYWVEAFGPRGLRQRLFKSVATFATDRLTHHLGALASGEVRAGMATEFFRGKERMALSAEWEWGAGDYATASSGQDRRLDLALFAAIQDIAERRTLRGFPVRVFDEPSDALDVRGKELLAEWIMAEAATRGTTIVITHSTEFAALLRPSHIWTVIFDTEKGSYVDID